MSAMVSHLKCFGSSVRATRLSQSPKQDDSWYSAMEKRTIKSSIPVLALSPVLLLLGTFLPVRRRGNLDDAAGRLLRTLTAAVSLGLWPYRLHLRSRSGERGRWSITRGKCCQQLAPTIDRRLFNTYLDADKRRKIMPPLKRPARVPSTLLVSFGVEKGLKFSFVSFFAAACTATRLHKVCPFVTVAGLIWETSIRSCVSQSTFQKTQGKYWMTNRGAFQEFQLAHESFHLSLNPRPGVVEI